MLGPTLFSLFINDVSDIFNDLLVSLSSFADYVKLYTFYKLGVPHSDLQVAVDRLTNWARLWQLQIAVSECSTFRIAYPQWKIAKDIVNTSYSIDRSIIPFTDCVRDLGVYHDCRLKYYQPISIIVHNAYKRAVLILKSFHSRDPQILKRTYCVYVRSSLEFSCQIWSPHYKYLIDKIESAQTYFTKSCRIVSVVV